MGEGQDQQNVAELAANTIRLLAVDAVEKANSGHPGMPMGAADYAFVLWHRFLTFSASHPRWPNRDRFVLSAGHGSMLLYALLHLTGHKVSLEDLKNFRQWGSPTPGHPEYGHTEGVETTTGPLGQGIGNAVGMAIAEKMMATRFNTETFSPINHSIYGIVGDGDLMEGVASEAASLAGHLKLGKLIFFYDDNHISIDGVTEITFTEDVEKRFASYGWDTQRINGHNHGEIAKAIEYARSDLNRPSLIIARTNIAKGSPNKHDTPESHGAPLGQDEVSATRKNLNWPSESPFHIPEDVKKLFAARTEELEKEYQDWRNGLIRWRAAHPDKAKLWDAHWNQEIPANLYETLLETLPEMPNATRSISGALEQVVAREVPSLVGGGADLASSTKCNIKDSSFLTAEDFSGRNIHFGVREHAMGTIANGFAYNGGWIPFGSTFLVFSDYMRPPIRLAALSKLQVLHIFTHDSVLLGEDGPTHQPVEHLGSLRLIPNVQVIRPADTIECAAAWKMALDFKTGPTLFSLTRQNLPAIERDSTFTPQDVLRGGYIVKEAKSDQPDAILIATGSELHLAMEAKTLLEKQGPSLRVVSIPCLEIFEKQPKKYIERVLPKNLRKAVVEAARCDLWYKWIGTDGLAIGLDRFGASAPSKTIAEQFGFTSEAVSKKILSWLQP